MATLNPLSVNISLIIAGFNPHPSVAGFLQITVTGGTVTSGIPVTGGTDNATVSFTSTGVTAAKAVDSVTLGNGAGDTVVLGAGAVGSTQTIVLGSGAGDSITTTSLGTVNATVGSGATGTDTITADSAAIVHITAGNGTNVISAAMATSTTISVGTGANSITTGAGASGTIAFGAHATTVVDNVTVGASVSGSAEIISGLNATGGLDTITFAGDSATAFAAGGMTHLTQTGLVTSADPTQLASWLAAVAGAVTATTARGVTWFNFHDAIYLVETVASDAGTLAAGDTVVELTGVPSTFNFTKASATGGVLHLLG